MACGSGAEHRREAMQARLEPPRPPQAVAAQRKVGEHRPPEPRLVAAQRKVGEHQPREPRPVAGVRHPEEEAVAAESS